MATIFVQIASYRDPQLLPTLRDCIAKASRPENLRFGICWQRDETETLAEFEADDDRVRLISLDYRDSPGVCWARHHTQRLYDGETYTLQIDSHHRFAEGWDDTLIAMLAACDAPKPILTCYAPAFDPFDPGAAFSDQPLALAFDFFSDGGALLVRPQVIEDWQQLQRPVPGRFFSAHFAFAPGRFCRDVTYDPDYYFHGEEINMAVRAFTHGYDLFHPHRVVIWHEYTRKYRTKHWDDHAPEKVEIPWTKRNDDSLKRNRVLLGMEPGEIDFGPYGFGSVRTLADYERYAGVNFRLRLVQPYTFANKPPPNPDVYTDDAEWIERSTRLFWTRIRVPKEVVEPDADYDFWYVGVHDQHQTEIDRHDLAPTEIAAVLAQGRYEFICQYRSSQKAHSWTVWPHSRSRGWLTKTTGPIER